jgi:DNA-binding LacI/PurR family transcriptional regulator
MISIKSHQKMATATKTQHVLTRLRKQILRGDWDTGERLPAEDQMVTQLRASRRTIREALLSLAGEGLIDRRQGSGTYVADTRKMASVALLSRSTILTSTQSFFYHQLIDHGTQLIRSAGLRPVLEMGHGASLEEVLSTLRLFDKAAANHLLGVISTINIGPLDQQLEEAGIASVNLGIEAPTARYSVLLDYSRMSHLASELMAAHGYRDFSVMHLDTEAGHPGILQNRINRLYSAAAGFDPARQIAVPWSINCELAADEFKKLWAGPHRPRAIFFFDDGLADSTTRAILELGIKVPQELAIVTEASVGRRFQFPVPLTCIEFDPAEVITAAWAMLEKLIAGRPVEQSTVYIHPRVRMGESL